MKKRSAGHQPTANAVLARALVATTAILLVFIAGVVTYGLISADRVLSFSASLGIGAVLLAVVLGFVTMKFIAVYGRAVGAVTVGSYALKLVLIATVVLVFRDYELFDHRIAGLAFVGAVIINLVISAVIVIRYPSPFVER